MSSQEVGEIFGSGKGPAHSMMRSPTVLIASVGLWGMNLYFFRLFSIDYVKVLKYDLLLIDGNTDNNNTDTSLSSRGLSKTRSDPEEKNLERTSSVDELLAEIDDDEDDEGQSYQAITWTRLVGLSMTLLLLLHFTYYYWIDIIKGSAISAVFLFYGVVVLAILFPLPSTLWLRKATYIVLERSGELVRPRCFCDKSPPPSPRPIPFVDVFYADAMCSLSKVFFDWGMLLHLAWHYPQRVPNAPHNIILPSLAAALPYFIRARQCWVMYRVGRHNNDNKRISHLWNALKYSTSILPLALSAYQKTLLHTQARQFTPLLIVLLATNALYALYWDVVMDWGMLQQPRRVVASAVLCGRGGPYPLDQARPPSCGHALLRSRLRFGVAMSIFIVLADAVLRFSWTLRWYHKLFPSADSFVLCTQFLEVFRRALWNLLRIEWENLKQSKSPPILKSMSTLSTNNNNNISNGGGEEEMTSFLPKLPRKEPTKDASLRL